MYEEIQRGIAEVKNLDAELQGPLTAWIYGWVVINVVYYLMLGLVVIFLGLRLISATVAALKESQRVAAQETQGA